MTGASSSGNGTMTVKPTSFSQDKDYPGFYQLGFTLQDGGVNLSLSTLSQGYDGGASVDGSYYQHAGSALYSVETECLWADCSQYVALVQATPDNGKASVQVAVLYKVDSQGNITTVGSPVWNGGFQSVNQAAATLQSNEIVSSGAS